MERTVRSIVPALLVLLIGAVSAAEAQPPQSVAARIEPADGTAASVLEQPANLSVEDLTLEQALTRLYEGSGVPVSFSPSALPRTLRVSCRCRDVTVAEALDSLLAGTPLRYREVEGHVLVFDSALRPTIKPQPSPARYALARPVAIIRSSPPVVAGTITGRVMDTTTQQPLADVSVALVGTSRTTLTDADGRFVIADVPSGAQRVRVNLIGYATQEQSVTVADGETVDVTFQMQSEALQLEEIVAVGYGTQRRRDVTGTISSVNVEEITDLPITNVQEGLQARVAGVQIVQNEGAPGADYTVRVRGGNSMLGSNAPLYVIDGFPATSAGVLGTITPTDIESIEILKDASATAIYGARGANGVVMITTKRGQSGRNVVQFEAYTGIQSLSKKIPMMNAQEFATVANELATSTGQELPFPDLNNLTTDTDWQDALFTDASISSFTASFSGGDANTRYLVSGNYLNQDGIVPTTHFERGTLRFNLEQTLSSRFRIANQLMLSRSNGAAVHTSGEGIIMSTLAAPPTVPVYDEDGDYSDIGQYFFSPNAIENPLAEAYERLDEETANRLLGNVTAEYDLLPGLRVRMLLGADYVGSKADFYATRLINAGGTGGTASQERVEALSYLNENTLSYDHDFANDHRIATVAGFTWQEREINSLEAGASGFVNDDLSTDNLGAGEVVSIPSTRVDNWKLLSWLARVNYSIKDRYLFTVTGRADGSSRFGAGNKWGFFPSAAFAWRVTDEPFLQGQSTISDLKLRVSWGRTGNQEIGLYKSLQRIDPGAVVIGDQAAIGLAPTSVANPKLRWETTEQFDIGVDLGLWQDRLRLTADVYRKNTSDLLAEVQLSPSSGFGSVLKNAGGIRNTGIELGLGADLVRSDRVLWSTDINVAANRNVVTEVADGNEFFAPAAYFLTGSAQIIREGEPMSAFFLLEEDGLDEEGRIRYIDQNGDGVISDLDRVIVADPNPDLIYGISTHLSYGPFDFAALVQGVRGVHVLNTNLTQLATSMERGTNQIADLAGNYWTEENPDPGAKYPKISLTSGFGASDRFLEDASFVRLKSAQLTYRLPVTRLGFLSGVANASIYLAGQNLLTFTDYSGYDPEVSAFGNDNLRPGIDLFNYPKSRTVTVGMKVGF